jgi:hypothetical protein
MGEDDVRAPETDVDDLRLAFRPSRIASLSAKAALFALPVIAAVAGCANSSPGTVTRTVSPASSRSAARTQPGAVCTGAQLSGKVSRAGSQSSAPFAEIVLTNGGPGSCQLSGYPQLTVWGPTGHGPSAPLKTVLTGGSTFEIPDAGPRTVVILPGRSAWFTIGTGTAYGSPIVVFERVVIDVGSTAGGEASHVNVALSMDATSPPGKAIPVTVTAFASGVPPKP